MRLSSFVYDRKAEAFFFFFFFFYGYLETSLWRFLGKSVKNTAFGHTGSISPLHNPKALCSGNLGKWSSEDLLKTNAGADDCLGSCESTRHPGRAHI